jgi:LPXTG-motif cell wall-anchored protein
VKRRRIITASFGVALTTAAIVSGYPVAAEVPPGYTVLPGAIPLNPAHVGSVGSEFTQDCTGLPRPVAPGEVAWHFVLPQSVLELFGPNPTNVFDTLTVTFASFGIVTLDQVAQFGPPHQAHAYIYTPTNDTLLAGTATVGRRDSAPVQATNDSQFNLSHTCASTEPPTSTTTAGTTTTTTAATTTTTTTAPSGTTTTLDPNTPTTTNGGASPVPPTSAAGGGGQLPSTGRSDGVAMIAIIVSILGVALVTGSRKRVT